MLDERRIKEAEHNVKAYLQDGLLSRAAPDNPVTAILLGNGKESLLMAQIAVQQSDLWAIVCSYYAMFYYANAVLRKHGFKVGEKISHKVTADAMIAFIRNKLAAALVDNYLQGYAEALPLAGVKADDIIGNLDKERIKRGAIQYKTLAGEKHAKALTSLQRAKEFCKEMEKLL